MEKRTPNNLLFLLERWFSLSMTCAEWCNIFSTWFSKSCGIRQGGLSVYRKPYLFAIYIVNKVQSCRYGCYVRHIWVGILLYADDILLLSIVNLKMLKDVESSVLYSSVEMLVFC